MASEALKYNQEPRVAVVVPIFRHSVLLTEAVESILAQVTDFSVRIILVNDGCPHTETDMVCREYAITYPESITYLCKPNGGLSHARNYGIQHALTKWTTVEAIYLLDADNKLRAHTLQRAMIELSTSSGIGWIYPNIDMFGTPKYFDYGGDYSLLIHTIMNICEAGSLIHRRVFEAGIYFDTDFKMGFEDWDFFLSAGKAGFKGLNLENFGFLYRKRPESMLADSGRDEKVINGAMRIKHKELMNPKSLVALEHQECPRYAIYLEDRNEFILTVDPNDITQRVTREEFEQRYWNAHIVPSRYHIPPYLLVTSSKVLEGLLKSKVLHWTVWRMENMLRYSGISTLNISQLIEDRLGYVEYTSADGRQVSALAVMIGSKLLKDILVDSNTDWINSLTSGICQPKVSAVELQLLPDADILDSLIDTTASFNLLSLLHHLRTSAYRQASFKKWDWREQGIPWRARANEIIKRGFNGFATYPKVVNEKRHIGFILPLIEFGGVEKVALNMAQGMKAQNWIPHLFVIDSTNGAISKEWRDTFETVNFLSDRDFKSWGHAQTNYYGTDVPDWATNGQHGQALALLHWLDAIVNCHGGSISGIMGQLKRFGVKTVLSLHLSDLSLTNRPVGNTYLGLAYEHAYDFFAPCSYRLGNWCHALGIPAEKIITVPNAPSFPISTAVLEETQLERTTRDPLIPLRVMYIGRLDRQKGIDRLSTVINETLKQGLEIEWRVIGKSVIVEDAPPLSPEIISLIEPPIIAYEGLFDVYTWADVFVLLSSFEGLPLTILEAMRSGVVVLATDVGAVSEVLRNDVNGVLLNLNTAVPECVSALSNLAQDRSRLQRLSAQAFNEMRERDWVAATRPLSSALLELLEKDKPT